MYLVQFIVSFSYLWGKYDSKPQLLDCLTQAAEELKEIGFFSETANYITGCIIILFFVSRDDSRNRQMFIEHMIEDKTESSMSYYEFLQHLQKNIKS